MMTSGMVSIAWGAALAYTSRTPVSGLLESLAFLGRGTIEPFPVPMLIAAVVYIVAYLVLTKTVLGRYVYGISGNAEASRLSGINVNLFRIMVYAISGLAAALSGLILASRLSFGQPMAWSGMELDAIAASVLGGIAFTGGKGNILGTLIGALLITTMNNGLDLLNVNTFYQLMFKGCVLLLALAMQRRG